MTFHYLIELRDKYQEDFIEILEADVFSCDWSYYSNGGCGEATISLRRDFDNFGDIDLDYDVQIWRVQAPIFDPATGPDFGGGRELRWSGFVRNVKPVFDENESVVLSCFGYGRQLEYVMVPAAVYAGDAGGIAQFIIDTYVTPKSQILRTIALSLCQSVGVTLEAFNADGSVKSVLDALAELGGNAEWGVRADREIYFLPRTSTLKHTYLLGGSNAKLHESESSTDEVVHKVYLDGAPGFSAVLDDGYNEAGYSKERTMLVPAISTAADAILWGTAFFSRYGSPQPKGRLVLAAGDDWIESVGHPLGRLRVLSSE